MTLFHLLGYTTKLVFGSSTSVTRLNELLSLLKHLANVAFC